MPLRVIYFFIAILSLTASVSADQNLVELKSLADDWTRKAHEQSKQSQGVQLLIPNSLPNLPPLTSEPSRELLNSRPIDPPQVCVSQFTQFIGSGGILETSRGNYFFSQVQARASEDRGQIQLWSSKEAVFALVLDGHSPSRECVKGSCDEAHIHFEGYVYERIHSGEHPLQAFQKAATLVQQAIEEKKFEDGTTLTACYHDLTYNKVWGALLGDSLAIVYRMTTSGLEIHRLTYLESWDDETAKARIPVTGEWQVKDKRIIREGYAGLNVTRSLGDLYLYPAVCQDLIYWHGDLHAADVLLIASDGLFNWLSEQQIGELIRNWNQQKQRLYPSYFNLAELLIAKARERALHCINFYSPHIDPDTVIDDMTVILFVASPP